MELVLQLQHVLVLQLLVLEPVLLSIVAAQLQVHDIQRPVGQLEKQQAKWRCLSLMQGSRLQYLSVGWQPLATLGFLDSVVAVPAAAEAFCKSLAVIGAANLRSQKERQWTPQPTTLTSVSASAGCL